MRMQKREASAYRGRFPLICRRLALVFNGLLQMVEQPERIARLDVDVNLFAFTSVDAHMHLEQFRRFVGFKKPAFIDKPFVVSSAEAQEIIGLAAEHCIPVMCASVRRYAGALFCSPEHLYISPLQDSPKASGGTLDETTVSLSGCNVNGLPGCSWGIVRSLWLANTVVTPYVSQMDLRISG
jgi:hypothetical protein